MLLDTNQIWVNGENWGKYLTNAEYQYNKLWGDDTGRNLEGEFSGSFKGVYPKLVLTFGKSKLTKETVEKIMPILNSPSQTVTYYDPVLKRDYTMRTYTGDVSLTNKRKNICESMSVSFIAMSRRSSQ